MRVALRSCPPQLQGSLLWAMDEQHHDLRPAYRSLAFGANFNRGSLANEPTTLLVLEDWNARAREIGRMEIGKRKEGES